MWASARGPLGMRDGVGMGSRGATREGGTRGTRARDARLRVRAVGARAGACGELAWGGARDAGRNAPRSSTPPPPARSRGDSDGKADRYGLFLARLTVMARFSTFSGRKNAKGGVKPQVAKIEAASRGHKSCHNGHPCHPSAITVDLAIRKLRPSPLPSGRNSHPPCRCDDANARTKKQQELSERGYFAIPAPSISDGELLQGEAPPCHSANALHRSFETQQGNRATKKGWRRIRSDASLWCGRARRMPPRTNQ